MTDRFTVLIVDDNPNNLFTLRELLAAMSGVTVVEAVSGEMALQQVLEHDIQLILLDVQMPDMDGYETASHLKMIGRTRNIPIVFLTAAFKSDEFVRHGYAVGAVDYLTKPLDDHLLINRIRHYQHLHEREAELEERTHALEQALEQLRKTHEQMVQSEKLAALGAIVAAVAHELNTPLGNCLTVSTTLAAKTQDLDDAIHSGKVTRSALDHYLRSSREATQLLERGLSRACELVASFKQVAVDQSTSQRRPFDFKEVVEGVVALMQVSLRRTPYVIEMDISSGLEMDSYPGPIEQIVTNLMSNAIVHAFDGYDKGRMTIAARRIDDTVVIEFSDDGCGMDESIQRHIFDPFFTTRLGRGGSGLGMNICYNLVTGPLGGTINLQSALAQGTTFKIVLPLIAPTSGQVDKGLH